MTLGIGVEHVIETPAEHAATSSAGEDLGEVVLTVDAQPGVPITVTKYVTYQSSSSAPAAELVDRCVRALDRSVTDGFDALLEGQRAQLTRFWDRADVRVAAEDDSTRMQQAIRWSLFQVVQATWRAEGRRRRRASPTAAEGHYFWDTEMYVLPMLSYTSPRIARNLLRFRSSMLPKGASGRAS